LKEINIAKAKDSFSEIIARVSYSGERVLIKRRTRAVAAIVPLQDLEKIQAQDGEIKGSLLGAAGAWKGIKGIDKLIDNIYSTSEIMD
jgi:prevent-host-death family protein